MALLVKGDRAVFRNLRLLGNQDTVYAGSCNCTPDGENCITARQYFSDCYIAGNVDFIFGDGKSVFDHCEIHSTAHAGDTLLPKQNMILTRTPGLYSPTAGLPPTQT